MSSPQPASFVGRTREQRDIGARLDRATAGVGGLVLLSGQAGLGKTALCEQMVLEARRRGFTPAWASCWQTTAVPPLLPWTQLIAELAAGEDATDAMQVTSTDPRAGRREQALAVLARLRTAAVRPLLLVIDDLQWADAATVEVLEHVAASLPTRGVVVLAAHRPADDPDSPLAAALPALRRRGLVIEMDGLDVADTAALVEATTGVTARDDVALALREVTGGNPLFTRELSRTLPTEALIGTLDLADLTMPTTVQSVIAERVAALGEGCRSMLAVLAVAGDTVEADVVEAVAGVPRQVLLNDVDVGIAAGLVTGDGVRLGFTHAVFRAAVYASLSTVTRVALHDRLARTLVRLQDEDGRDVDPAALAHHFGRSVPAGNAAAAFAAALDAARAAEAVLAFDLAIRRYEQALSILALDPTLGERLPVLLALGEAQIADGDPRSREAFTEAAQISRRQHDAPALGRAALGLSGGSTGIEVVVGDRAVCDLLDEAAAGLADDNVLGALIEARRSVASSYLVSRAERERIAEEARRRADAGGDPAVIAQSLAAWCDAMAGPGHVQTRRQAAMSITELARAAHDSRGETLGLRLLVEALLEAGDLDGAAAAAGRFEVASAALGHVEYGWYPALWRAAIAFARGDLGDHARQRALLRERAAGAAGTNAMLLADVADVARALDLADPEGARRGVELIRGVGGIVDDVQVHVTLGLLRAVDGDLDGARAGLDRWLETGIDVDRDSEWAPLLLQLAETVVAVGGHPGAERLRRTIRPFADVWVVEGIGAGIRGPLHRAMGLLAAIGGDTDVAMMHLAEARAAAARAGAAMVVATVDHAQAVLLDDREARARAAAAWQRFGAASRLAALGMTGPAADHRTSVAGGNTFLLDGDVWRIAFGGAACTMRDRKGLRDIAALISQPTRQIAALDLASLGPAVVQGGHGETIDAEARQAYRARLIDIEAELDEADAMSDIERSTRLAAERDALAHELAGAYGLGGRARETGRAAERARTAVRARIRDALDHLDAAHPSLARHLARSLRTGTFCVYDPDPSVTWVTRVTGGGPPHTV